MMMTRRIPQQWFRRSSPSSKSPPPLCHRRSLAAWWRGGGAFSQPSLVTVDVSKKRHYPMHIVNGEYLISICSIQGYRSNMEDEFMIHTTSGTSSSDAATATTSTTSTPSTPTNHQLLHDPNHQDHTHGIVACFDGHGGKAVSRYLRRNLYTNLIAALTMIQQTKPKPPPPPAAPSHQLKPHSSTTDTSVVNDNDMDDNDDDESILSTTTSFDLECPNDEGQTHHHHHHVPLNDQDQHSRPPIHPAVSNNEDDDDDTYIVEPHTIIPPPAPPPPAPSRGTLTPTATPLPIPDTFISNNTHPNSNNSNNNDSAATIDDYVSALEVALDKVDREVLRVRHWKHQGSTAIVCWIHEETTIASSPANQGVETTTTNTDSPPLTPRTTTTTRTLITANIGDSRAILCRNGMAIPLSRDHKPNDPIEFHRIHRVGGTVVWDGDVDRMREPVPGMGCYRVNGNLALSRVIGDRSERPVVNSDPDITLITLVSPEDEFIVVATDGLWDVMSSSDTVAFIRALLGNMDQDVIDRDSIASYVVEEALRRGSYDNITVIIVWLQ